MLSLWKEEVENWVCNLACIECSKGGCARAFPPKTKKKWKNNAFFLLCTFRKVIHDFCEIHFFWGEYHKLQCYVGLDNMLVYLSRKDFHERYGYRDYALKTRHF